VDLGETDQPSKAEQVACSALLVDLGGTDKLSKAEKMRTMGLFFFFGLNSWSQLANYNMEQHRLPLKLLASFPASRPPALF